MQRGELLSRISSNELCAEQNSCNLFFTVYLGTCSCLAVVRRDRPAFGCAEAVASPAVIFCERGPACSLHRISWI